MLNGYSKDRIIPKSFTFCHESIMQLHLFQARILSCLVFFLIVWLAAGSPPAAEYQEEVSTEKYLFAKGIIHSVGVAEQTVTIKINKGPKIVLSVDQDTLFEGFYKLDELKARQIIKVWYQPGEPTNRALKIVKPLELGC